MLFCGDEVREPVTRILTKLGKGRGGLSDDMEDEVFFTSSTLEVMRSTLAAE
jgi:hypothetical protein